MKNVELFDVNRNEFRSKKTSLAHNKCQKVNYNTIFSIKIFLINLITNNYNIKPFLWK